MQYIHINRKSKSLPLRPDHHSEAMIIESFRVMVKLAILLISVERYQGMMMKNLNDNQRNKR